MELKDLLGGKGANLAEMTSVLEPAGAPGLHHLDRRLPRLHGRAAGPTASTPRWREARTRLEKAMGKRIGDAGDPLLVSRALRRQVLHARDDGHRPQPRAQRRVGRGPGQADRRRALRLRLLPPVHRHVRPHRARASPARSSTRCFDAAKELAGTTSDAERARPSCCATWSTRTSRSSSATPASPSPRTRPTSCAAPSRPCSARWNGAAGHRLPRPRAHRPRPRHRGQRAGHGVRQPRRQLGHRRRLHPRPGHRRQGRLRRLPGQRPGRGRGGRHPQHRAARRR